jgi:hypothetical protein
MRRATVAAKALAPALQNAIWECRPWFGGLPPPDLSRLKGSAGGGIAGFPAKGRRLGMDPLSSAQSEPAAGTALSPAGPRLGKLSAPEAWCKIALLAVFGAFYLAAASYPEKARQFPQLIAALSLLLTVISLGTDLLRRGPAAEVIGGVDDTELGTVAREEKRARRARFYKAWAILLASTAAGFLGGFLLTALLLFVGFALFFGSKGKLGRNLSVSVAVTAVIYVIFTRLMAVPLLDGLLW